MTRAKLLPAVTTLFTVILGSIALDALIPALTLWPTITLPDSFQNFATIFLGIFIEAAPFLLLGSLASGLIAVFVNTDDVAKFFPRNPILATLAGASLGIVFPVCECGVVPVVRRLAQKGLPMSAGLAFLLAAPVINPVVMASTYAAFGLGLIFWARLGLTLLVAVVVGLVFMALPQLSSIVRPRTLDTLSVVTNGASLAGAAPIKAVATPRLQQAFIAAAEDFFDVGRYLVLGSTLAAALQTFVPQSALVTIGDGPIASVFALQTLAYLLSVCSTVDAFLALSFVGTFTTGSIITFLVFGPMVDIKSTLMYLGLLKKRPVLYIVLLTYLMTLLFGIFINLNVGA